jgi:hypothetical protein
MIEDFLSNQGAVPSFINYRLHLNSLKRSSMEWNPRYLPVKVQILLGKSGCYGVEGL